MKFLKGFLITFAILVLVLISGVVIFIKTFDVNRFKPQIVDQANKLLGLQVDFQKAKLDISLKQGISLNVNNLVIAPDAAFGKGDFFSVKEVSFSIDALGYLFKRKIDVSGVFLDSPCITIIRRKDGLLNAQSFGRGAQASESVKPAPAQAALAAPALFVSYLKGDNGKVSFIDQSFEPAVTIEISDLSFSFNKISLSEPFPFIVEAAVLSAGKNIKLEGRAGINLKAGEIAISDLKGALDLSQIILDKIPVFFPMVKGAVLPVGIKGLTELQFSKLIIGQNGLNGLGLSAALKNGELQFKEMALPIKNINADFKVTENKVILDKISAGIGEGAVEAAGLIEDYLSAQGYGMDAVLNNLKIQELIAQDKSPVKVEGLVSGKIKINGKGLSPQAVVSGLSGQADISVREAKLKDINVLRTVLDKVSMIPGLAQKFEAGLPERYKEKLSQKDTALSDIRFPATIENGRIFIKDAVIAADEFLFKGICDAGLDGSFSLEGSFLIPEELSAAMVEKAGELEYLLNDAKQIYIPLKVSGKAAGELKFNVDTEYIAKKLVEDQVRKQIFKVLDKVIGPKEEPSEAGKDKPQVSPEEKTGVEEAVDDVLRRIFE